MGKAFLRSFVETVAFVLKEVLVETVKSVGVVVEVIFEDAVVADTQVLREVVGETVVTVVGTMVDSLEVVDDLHAIFAFRAEDTRLADESPSGSLDSTVFFPILSAT